MKKSIITIVLSITLSGAMAGIPVTDPKSIARDIKQWTAELKKWEEQIKQAKGQLTALTGNRDVSSFLEQIKPMYDKVGNLEELVKDPSKIMGMGFDSLDPTLKELYKKEGLGKVCDTKVGRSKKICEGQIVNEINRSHYVRQNIASLKKQTKRIDQLAQKIGKTKDMQETQNLQAQIQAETANLEVLKLKMQLERENRAFVRELLEQEKEAERQRKLDKRIKFWQDKRKEREQNKEINIDDK